MTAIQVAQWVYGRVATGVSGSPGYQVAAASASVAQNRKLADRLTELSQYPQSPEAKQVRWGYADTGLGWATFWRCALARDMSGRIGYFAHHRLVRIDDVVALGHVPVELLWRQPFFTREADLPRDRTLPELDLKSVEAETVSPPAAEALQLAEALVARGNDPAVPALLTGQRSDEGLVRIAAETLSLLPPPIALATAFCINFTGSRDGLVRFSFVSSPAEELLATPRVLFRVIDPATRAEPRSPLIQAIASRVVDVRAYQGFARAVCGWDHSDRVEDAAVWQATDHPFAGWLEHDWPNWNRDYLDADPARYAVYFTRCPSWSADRLRPLLAQAPMVWAQAFEPFLAREDIRAVVCGELAERLARTAFEAPVDPDTLHKILEWLARNDLFGDVSDVGAAWPFDRAARLADRFAGDARYDGRLHRRISSRLLASEDTQAWVSWCDWLVRNRDHCGTAGGVIRALLGMQRREPRPRLPTLESLDPGDYEHTLHAVVQLVSRQLHDPRMIEDMVTEILCDAHRTAGHRFLARLVDAPVFSYALRAAERVGFLDTTARSALIEGLKQAPTAGETARHWLALVRESEKAMLTPEQRQTLEYLASGAEHLSKSSDRLPTSQ